MSNEIINSEEKLNSADSFVPGEGLSDEIKKSLFAQEDIEDKAEEETAEEDIVIPAPETGSMNVPLPGTETETSPEDESVLKEFSLEDVTSEDILSLIESMDEAGHTPSFITAYIERIVNVTEGMTIDDLTEDNKVFVDQIHIEDASVAFDAMDDEIATCTLTFDTANDAYLRELNEFLNRYKIMCKNFAEAEDQSAGIPLFTLSFAPKDFKGFCVMQITSPVFFARCLNDSGTNASMLIAFRLTDMSFSKIDMTEDEYAQLQADVYREVESGTGGMLFE